MSSEARKRRSLRYMLEEPPIDVPLRRPLSGP